MVLVMKIYKLKNFNLIDFSVHLKATEQETCKMSNPVALC